MSAKGNGGRHVTRVSYADLVRAEQGSRGSHKTLGVTACVLLAAGGEGGRGRGGEVKEKGKKWGEGADADLESTQD